MTRILLLCSVLLLASLGCSPRYDVFVAWTIEGSPAAAACQQLRAPLLRFTMHNRDTLDGPVMEETATAPCGDGQATLRTGAYSEVFVDILDREEVFGGSGPLRVSPGAGAQEGATLEEPITTDLSFEQSRIRARLTVVGKRCADANISFFEVTLRRNTSPLGQAVVHEERVSCQDGEAIFEYAPLDIGSVYEVVARASVAGVDYATSDASAGEGVLVERAVTELDVDLDLVGRP